MLAVIPLAWVLGFGVYIRGWEARRVVMDQQKRVTQSLLFLKKEDIAAADRPMSQLRQERVGTSYADHWMERLEGWEVRDGRRVPLIRVIVSGANGRFRAPPIDVVYSGPSSGYPWLDRLLRAYQAKGWSYRVVRRPNLSALPSPKCPAANRARNNPHDPANRYDRST
jgi:hypothetical protein